MKKKTIFILLKAAVVCIAVLLPIGLVAQQAASQPVDATGFTSTLKLLNLLLIIIGVELAAIAIMLVVKDPKNLSLGGFFDSVTGKTSREEVMHHTYDGIQEIDNPVPAWLKAIFYSTIGWGFLYLVYYTISGTGPNQLEEYRAEMKQYEVAKVVVALKPEDLKIITDKDELKKGASTFKSICSTCHGMSGEGGAGPNLTDKYWIHGGTVSEIYNVISNGVPGKTMMAWKTQISNDKERLAIASYIVGLQGSNPPNALKPDGVLFEGDPNELPFQKSDSTLTSPADSVK